MIAWSTAALTVILLALSWVAIYPPGAVVLCREAIAHARAAGGGR